MLKEMLSMLSALLVVGNPGPKTDDPFSESLTASRSAVKCERASKEKLKSSKRMDTKSYKYNQKYIGTASFKTLLFTLY